HKVEPHRELDPCRADGFRTAFGVRQLDRVGTGWPHQAGNCQGDDTEGHDQDGEDQNRQISGQTLPPFKISPGTKYITWSDHDEKRRRMPITCMMLHSDATQPRPRLTSVIARPRLRKVRHGDCSWRK